MKKAMLITVGTGRGGDVAHGIAFALRQEKPDFVLFIGTAVSLRDTLPLVLQEAGCEEGQYETRTTANENDVDRSAVEYVGYVQEVRQRDYKPEEIVVDFTSGTKAMSAALVVAALAEEIGSISYVHGERGDGGRVISGTERLNALEPNLMLADGKLRKVAELFNAYQYTGCLAILDDLRARLKQPEVTERIDLLSGLAEAYQAWDRFDHKTAMVRLDGLTSHPLLPAWGLKKKVETHKQFLHRMTGATDRSRTDTSYSVERAVDLRNNAGRRAEEGKFDDAVARLYRLLEYIGQVKLYRDYGGLIAGDLDVSKLPEAIREKYAGRRERGEKVKLDLIQDFELLSDLGDPMGQQFMDDFRPKGSEVKVVLGLRNNSILAHGFGPVGEGVHKRAVALVERYLDAVFPVWRDVAKGAAFPTVRNV